MSNTQLNEALASNYLLADIQLRSWSGKRTDKGATEELIASKNAAKDSGAFVKNLMASARDELDQVHRCGTAIRNFVYARTLSWSAAQDGARRGARLLPSAQAMEFLQDLHEIKQTYDGAVQELIKVWPVRVAQAQANLGALADATEYPDAGSLGNLFSVQVDLLPIPTVTDFSRLSVPAPLAEALGARFETQAQLSVQNAMDDLRSRFIDELQRFEKQMAKHGSGEKTRLYETLLTNMQGLVNMARSMNITGNPKLTELADKIESKLLQLPIDAYKEDQARAAVAAAEAKDLQMEAAVDEVWAQT